MSVEFVVNAKPRAGQGKGASRRLRREGWVPAILYGGHQDPKTLVLEQRQLLKHLEQEAFYSSVLNIDIDGKVENAILRDLQRHPYKPTLLHVDLQRVTADEEIRVHIPLHFINENKAPGIAEHGGVASHHLIEVEVSALPKDLPEYIEVDVSGLDISAALHLSELKLPQGVTLTQHIEPGDEHDVSVVSIHHARRAETEETEAAEEGGEEEPE